MTLPLYTESDGISVIICTWNRATSLRMTLESLSQQSDCDDLDIEIIVVDNNSTDDTQSIVEDLRINWQLGVLRYIFEPQQGKQFALNLGIESSTKSILAFTDDDILFPADWLANINKVFLDPLLELAGGKTQILWPDSGKPSWYHDSMRAIVGGVDLGNKKLSPPPAGYAPAGANLIARRTLFDKVGGYSEVHFRHMDYEFGIRCAKAGIQITYEPSLVVYVPVDSACLTKRYFRRWSFKAGISNEEEISARSKLLLGIPLWRFRQLFEDILLVMLSILKDTNKAQSFSYELRICRNYGMIISRFMKKIKPKHYSLWVEKYSQKKGNLY